MGLTEYGHIATEETQLRVADLLQAIAAGSAGPEYTDATFKALLDDTNTTEIFSAWWPLSAASNDSKYKRLLRFFTMLQTDKTYTVKFPSPAVSTNPAGTPADDLAGKSAAALATDSTNPEDWAEEDRMTWYIRANTVSLADGTMDVLAIEGEEEFDITGTLAPVYTFAPALLRRVIDDGSYLSKSWRSTLADGFTPYAENVAPNGKRRAMTWHATFPGGLNAKGALTSGAGLPVANFNSAVTGLALARKQTAYDSVWGDCDSLYMLDMWQLRHFDLENSRILEGCTNYNLQYKVAAAETGVKRVLLTASQASGFIVGSTVSVGDKAGNSSADRYNTWMRDICFPPPAPQRKPRKALRQIFPAGGSTAKHGKARRKPRLSRSAWPSWKILWSQSWRANTHEQILYHRAAAVSAAQNHRRPGVGVHRKRPAQNHRRRSAGNLRPARQR